MPRNEPRLLAVLAPLARGFRGGDEARGRGWNGATVGRRLPRRPVE